MYFLHILYYVAFVYSAYHKYHPLFVLTGSLLRQCGLNGAFASVA